MLELALTDRAVAEQQNDVIRLALCRLVQELSERDEGLRPQSREPVQSQHLFPLPGNGGHDAQSVGDPASQAQAELDGNLRACSEGASSWHDRRLHLLGRDDGLWQLAPAGA